MGIANQGVTPGRTTLLEAVNICMQNIGEQPVNSLEDPQIVEASTAERTILEFHKEGQTRGWSWNSEQGYEFLKDAGTSQITVPTNLVSFAPDAYQWAGRFQLRGAAGLRQAGAHLCPGCRDPQPGSGCGVAAALG